MSAAEGSLRGYALPVHRRDRFKCQYCGLDGKVWQNWLCRTMDDDLTTGKLLARRRGFDIVLTRSPVRGATDS